MERQRQTGMDPSMLMRHDFRPEFIDFDKGIRVGHLASSQRITQILKRALQKKFQQTFVIDRFGRGVHWQWICFVPKAHRQAKPVSSRQNFGCCKFFIMVDRDERIFKTGIQVERGFIDPPPQWGSCRLAPDWDWHRLIQKIQNGAIFLQLRQLCDQEGFQLFAGSWNHPHRFSGQTFPTKKRLLEALQDVPRDDWSALQFYYPMTPQEVTASSGTDLVEAILAAFTELVPVMNEFMNAPLGLPQPRE